MGFLDTDLSLSMNMRKQQQVFHFGGHG